MGINPGRPRVFIEREYSLAVARSRGAAWCARTNCTVLTQPLSGFLNLAKRVTQGNAFRATAGLNDSIPLGYFFRGGSRVMVRV